MLAKDRPRELLALSLGLVTVRCSPWAPGPRHRELPEMGGAAKLRGCPSGHGRAEEKPGVGLGAGL